MTEKCLPGTESQTHQFRRMVQTDVKEMIQRLPATGRTTPKISTYNVNVQEGSLELCPAFVVQETRLNATSHRRQIPGKVFHVSSYRAWQLQCTECLHLVESCVVRTAMKETRSSSCLYSRDKVS
jgi:hypothetical protein